VKKPLIGTLAVMLMVLLISSLRAQKEELQRVPSQMLPDSGTFWSLQKHDSQPPFPFDPFQSLVLPVYSLGDGQFLKPGFHRANLEQFPYHFIYREIPEGIRVTLLRHHRRHPEFGMERK
jgi:hypothetical protein